MIQRGEDLRLALESRHAVRILREGGGQYFDRDFAAELRVGGPVHFTHAARSELAGNPIMSYALADHFAQGLRLSSSRSFSDRACRRKDFNRTLIFANDRSYPTEPHRAATTIADWRTLTRRHPTGSGKLEYSECDSISRVRRRS